MIKMYKPQKLSVIYHIITSYITIVIGFIPTYRAHKIPWFAMARDPTGAAQRNPCFGTAALDENR